MKTLITFFFIIFTSKLLACNAASQKRLFPIGQCPKGIVFLELDLYRLDLEYGTPGYNRNLWSGISNLRVFDFSYKLTETVFVDSLKRIVFNSEQVKNKYLDSIFNKSVEIAKNKFEITTVENQSLYFCEFNDTCQNYILSFNEKSKKINFKVSESKSIDISILLKNDNWFSKDLIEYYNEVQGGEIQNFEILKANISISSLRSFKMGNKTLLVFNLGSGNNQFGYENLSNKEKWTFEESIFYEPTLHHGHGFDFFVIF